MKTFTTGNYHQPRSPLPSRRRWSPLREGRSFLRFVRLVSRWRSVRVVGCWARNKCTAFRLVRFPRVSVRTIPHEGKVGDNRASAMNGEPRSAGKRLARDTRSEPLTLTLARSVRLLRPRFALDVSYSVVLRPVTVFFEGVSRRSQYVKVRLRCKRMWWCISAEHKNPSVVGEASRVPLISQDPVTARATDARSHSQGLVLEVASIRARLKPLRATAP